MSGVRLEVDTHLITGGSTSLRNLERCIERVGVDIDGFVFNGLAVLPNLNHPHNLVLAATTSNQLTTLHKTLVQTADQSLERQAEPNRFKPHVNLGRWSTPPHSRHDIRSKLHQFEMKQPWSFSAPSVTLFESQLQPTGARYRSIEVYPFTI